jgi:phenylacetate-CoA ligase
MMAAQNSDADFCPTLTDAGRKMLAFMREHPAAPIFRNQSGNRLLAPEVQALHAFEHDAAAAPVGWPRGGHPEWLGGHVQQVFEEVPHFQRLGSPPLRFEDIPTTDRSDLSADIASFVPNSVALDRMINFRTTGTTGNPLLIASHPVVAGRYLAFHKRALHRFGIELRHGAGQVGVVLLGFQKKCFTYVSVTPTMGDCGLAKINLHPNDWRKPDDRNAYLEALQAEVIAGDPISFGELLRMQPQIRPRALFSVGMMLSPGLRGALESRFSCPVLDFYSMNEAGPIGVFDAQAGGHVLLQPRLYVEILDEQGHTAPEGAPGEITLTGGFNFCLPLMRYRTGDHAALHWLADGPVLINLQGRKPVRFRCANGLWVNNIDVTHALAPLPLSQYTLHQEADGSFILGLAANALCHAAQASDALRGLFGDALLRIETIAAEGKLLQYTSDLQGQTSW